MGCQILTVSAVVAAVALFRRRVPFLCAAGVVLDAARRPRGTHQRGRLEGPRLALRKSGGGKRTGEPEEGQRDLRPAGELNVPSLPAMPLGGMSSRLAAIEISESKVAQPRSGEPGGGMFVGPCHANMPPKATAL